MDLIWAKNKYTKIVTNRFRSVSKAMIISLAGAFSLLLQVYWFPYASKTLDGNKDQFSFQLNVWNNEVWKTIAEIRHSGDFSKIAINEQTNYQKVSIDIDHLRYYDEFRFQIEQLTRQLEYQISVIAQFSERHNELYKEADSMYDEAKKQKIGSNIQALKDALEKQHTAQKKLAETVTALLESFAPDESKLSEDEVVNLHIKRMKAGMALYSDKSSLLQFKGDPFTFTREFGAASSAVFTDYNELIKEHNKTARILDGIKWIFIVSSICLAAIFTTRKEVKSVLNKPEDYEYS